MPADDVTDKRDRSPRFPYITMSSALDRSKQIYASSRGGWVRLSDAANDWGLSPSSSSALRTAAALLAYGLISDDGSGPARRIKLTPEAVRILTDDRPGVRSTLLREAVSAPTILMEYLKKWEDGRPTDKHAISALRFDSGFTERAARTFLPVIDDALQYLAPESPVNETSDADRETFIDGLEQHETEPVNVSRSPSADRALQGNAERHAGDSSEGQKWTVIPVAPQVRVTLYTTGPMTAKLLGRLVAHLQLQRESMMEDEEATLTHPSSTPK